MKSAFPFALVTLLALPGMAQSGYVAVHGGAAIDALGMNADDVVGSDVLDRQGRRLGRVETVVGGDPGTPEALVVAFGEETVGRVVPLGSFTMRNGSLTLMGDMGWMGSLQVWAE